jgi:glutamine synthetase
MSNQAVFEYVRNHPSGRVKIAVADIDGVLRGKYISSEKFLSVAQSNLGFCDVIFGWDMADVAYDNGTYTAWVAT